MINERLSDDVIWASGMLTGFAVVGVFILRSQSVYTRSVCGKQKLTIGPISYYRGIVCAGFTPCARDFMYARRVHTQSVYGAECLRAQRVRVSSTSL